MEVLIEDGMEFVKRTEDRFDVILCDSTDPEGPGAVLFTEEFYKGCKGILQPGGVFVNQSGVPFGQKEELKMVYSNLRKSFENVTFYLSVIPTYVGGYMAFGFATDERSHLTIDIKKIEDRILNIEGKTLYYNAKIHKACFSLPNFILEACPNIVN